MNVNIKLILHFLGGGIALSGIVFVSIKMSEYSQEIDFNAINNDVFVLSAVLVCIYAFASILLALAWRNLILHFEGDISSHSAIRIYGLSQLAKYVPGNIMHLASRQAMGLAEGIKGWVLAKSTFWDLGVSAITGTFFCILIIPLFFSRIDAPVTIPMFIIFIVGFNCLLNKFVSNNASKAFLYWTIFLIISGFVFVSLLILITANIPINISSILIYCGAFIIAWLIGLVTPGAPAGVGVRELILLMLLNGYVPESELLIVIMVSRIVTVSGDILFFIMSALIFKHPKKI